MSSPILNTFFYCSFHYKACPIEIRETFARLAGQEDGLEKIHASLSEQMDNSEIVVISTCNRFDVSLFGEYNEEKLLAGFSKLFSHPSLKDFIRIWKGESALRHLYRVAASLDSLVLGEPHILGQIKNAYLDAIRRKLCGRDAATVFHNCFQVAKRVRSETDLGKCGVSVGTAAVEVTKRISADLAQAKVLVIGAGEMARIATEHFFSCKVNHITLANRGRLRVENLVRELRGKEQGFISIIDLQSAIANISHFDIVVVATSSEKYLITPEDLALYHKQRSGRVGVIVDISMPRNVDPEVSNIENLFLFDVDDLDEVMDQNRKSRMAAAEKAEFIISAEVESFSDNRKKRESVAQVGNFHKWVSGILHDELSRTFQDRPLEEIETVKKAFAKKLVARVVQLAKADETVAGPVGDALKYLFDFGEKDK